MCCLVEVCGDGVGYVYCVIEIFVGDVDVFDFVIGVGGFVVGVDFCLGVFGYCCCEMVIESVFCWIVQDVYYDGLGCMCSCVVQWQVGDCLQVLFELFCDCFVLVLVFVVVWLYCEFVDEDVFVVGFEEFDGEYFCDVEFFGD